jgi:hypothetical protein
VTDLYVQLKNKMNLRRLHTKLVIPIELKLKPLSSLVGLVSLLGTIFAATLTATNFLIRKLEESPSIPEFVLIPVSLLLCLFLAYLTWLLSCKIKRIEELEVYERKVKSDEHHEKIRTDREYRKRMNSDLHRALGNKD